MRDINYRRLGILLGLGCLLTMLACASTASAQVGITITTPQQSGPTYTIYNANNQAVNFTVSSGSPGTSIYGADLWIQIDDGGPDNSGTANSGGAIAPTINTLDMTQGIFLGNNGGNSPNNHHTSPDLLLITDSISYSSGPVVANGLLGTLSLDAIGITPGTTFTILIGDAGANYSPYHGQPSDWVGAPPTATRTSYTGDGMSSAFTLEVVALPEPSTGLLLLVGAVCLLRRRRHTRLAA